MEAFHKDKAMRTRRRPGPTPCIEDEIRRTGYTLLAGIDEAGRGALAGPVVAAAVILRHSAEPTWLLGVRDSKELTFAKRETLHQAIVADSRAVGIGLVPPNVIDGVNILRATRLAMLRAISGLPVVPDFLLVDGFALSECRTAQRAVVDGDRLCLSIACASIVAKVTRDRIMERLDQNYPAYGFRKHKGYGTAEHLSCLLRLGPSPHHRFSFAPLKGSGEGAVRSQQIL